MIKINVDLEKAVNEARELSQNLKGIEKEEVLLDQFNDPIYDGVSDPHWLWIWRRCGVDL